ncbi:hypothetical protein BDV95DRAFT_488182 [Massariosphaeria phaeospora]|uniref:DUF4484 domain-containing protein n=1 Tax=Massariosphaeria phaeospora TaxID=100035 RepID=A0A7C8ICX0_9PLEO|nr:hypothetical protein BDV95DRAFT_488182 [Massariosphaeria phaeospora]
MSASTTSSVGEDYTGAENEAPKLSALFLIKFDKKVGYIIVWKRSSIDVPLDGAVEYKSLPSGLHSVKDDLVYFVHEGYAGLSAFVNAPASEAERNAQFVAVGVLVPLSEGRLGRSWLLAERLEHIASVIAEDPTSTGPLEDFWEEQSRPHAGSSSTKQPSQNQSRARALSTITAVVPQDQSLHPYHPARSILLYINIFGPLIFRLQQAALLRKRILFVGAPPVRKMCEFVFNLSVLSSISARDSEYLSPGTENLLRLPSLFSVGVHDIPLLDKLRSPETNDARDDALPARGWVACTTDEIIASKTQLYDIVVELPSTHDAAPQKRRWPTMRTSEGAPIRATQRDLRRYKLLHHELWKNQHEGDESNGDADADDDTIALLRQSTVKSDDGLNESYDDTVVEAMTWSRLAYLGFMWWASAGEQDADTAAERERDRDVLGDLSDYQEGLPTAIIAYFHRSTSLLVKNLNAMVDRHDEETDDDDDDALIVDRDDVSRLGLDTWSEADKAFIQEFLWMYFGRQAEVQGASLECCGMRMPVL